MCSGLTAVDVYWRRNESGIEAAGVKSPGVGDVATLGRNIIHSVLNPIGKMTCALHVYGGDFFEPDEPRSEWDHETLQEQPWDIDRVRTLSPRPMRASMPPSCKSPAAALLL